MIKRVSNIIEKDRRKRRKNLLQDLENCHTIEELKTLIKKIIELNNGRSL